MYCSPRWTVSTSFSRWICRATLGAAIASAMNKSAVKNSSPSKRYPCSRKRAISAVSEKTHSTFDSRFTLELKPSMYKIRRAPGKVAKPDIRIRGKIRETAILVVERKTGLLDPHNGRCSARIPHPAVLCRSPHRGWVFSPGSEVASSVLRLHSP